MAFSYVLNDAQRNPNLLINGDMAINQRAVSSATIGIGGLYIVDRWMAYTANGATTGTASVSSGSGIAGLSNFVRVQKVAASAVNGQFLLAQAIETAAIKKYQGRYLTVTFFARAGANFSGASSQLQAYVQAGTGTDESPRANYTGNATPLFSPATLTTTFQQFSFSFLVPTNCTELSFQLFYQSVGTAGAADYFDATGISLNEGGVQPFQLAGGGSYEAELAICQRYCWKVASTGMIANGYFDSTTSAIAWIRFPVEMRTTPTNTVNTASAFNVSRAASSASTTTGVSFSATDTRGTVATVTGSSISTVGFGTVVDLASGNSFTADAEIY